MKNESDKRFHYMDFETMYKRKLRNKEFFKVFLFSLMLGYVSLMSSIVLDFFLYPLTNFWTFGAIEGSLELLQHSIHTLIAIEKPLFALGKQFHSNCH